MRSVDSVDTVVVVTRAALMATLEVVPAVATTHTAPHPEANTMVIVVTTRHVEVEEAANVADAGETHTTKKHIAQPKEKNAVTVVK